MEDEAADLQKSYNSVVANTFQLFHASILRSIYGTACKPP